VLLGDGRVENSSKEAALVMVGGREEEEKPLNLGSAHLHRLHVGTEDLRSIFP
jgi:hypothetical protein